MFLPSRQANKHDIITVLCYTHGYLEASAFLASISLSQSRSGDTPGKEQEPNAATPQPHPMVSVRNETIQSPRRQVYIHPNI